MISVPLVARYHSAELHYLSIFINCKWTAQKDRKIILSAKIYANTQVLVHFTKWFNVKNYLIQIHSFVLLLEKQ